MRIEIVYSPAVRVVESRVLELQAGASVETALHTSGWWPDGVLPAGLAVGVWGRRRPLAQALHDGDRVEVCRDLLIDPKEARRQRGRAEAGRSRR